MVGVRDLSAGVARYLGKELQLDMKDIETLQFGMEYCLGAIINLGVIIGVAWCLGIMPYVLAAVSTVISLRLVSGGAHSSSFLRCLLLGAIVMVGIGKTASMVGMVPQNLLFALVGLSITGGFYALYKWAPADTPAKPIVSLTKRAKYRKLSYIYSTVWAAVMSVLILWGGELAFALTVASMGGFCWQIFTITPAGYRFATAVDRLV